ncbi:MAG TPA: DUF2079 domain-containing protein [Ktedonobacteraceae bacterium]|nr:DUF2079 domain-containing protein [Ktedonobacteraceae bacterium]
MLIAAIVIYGLIMGYQSILRYLTFKATAFDLGNMDQVLWNTIHGRLFQFTNQAIDWYGPPNRLGVHIEPIMLVVSLLYAVIADPRALLIFQTVVLAAGAPAVFLLTRRYFPAWPLLAVVMSAAYLVSPALLGINIFDFHPDCLATPLLLYAILALSYRRYVTFLFLCFLVCTCKEDMPLAIALFGVLLIWKYRLPRLGLILLLGGALWAVVAFKIVLPHFYGGVLANNFWYRYRFLGATPLGAIKNILTHPLILFTEVITIGRVYYVFSLLRSTGFLALLAPEWLLPALPKLLSNFLSSNQPNYSGIYHYNAAIIPFVILATLHGMRRFTLFWQGWSREQITQDEQALLMGKPAPDTEVGPYPTTWLPERLKTWSSRIWIPPVRLFKRLQPRFMRLTLPKWRHARWQRLSERMYPLTRKISTLRLQWFFCIWIIYMMGLNYLIAVPQLNSFWATHTPGLREQQIQQLLDMIPPDASVSASDDLNPHVSERQLLAVFPSICLDSTCDRVVDYIIVDLDDITFANKANAVSDINELAQGQYLILKQAGDVILLQRRST